MTARPGSPHQVASMPGANGPPDSAATLARSFLTTFRHHPAGVAIVTGDPGSGPVALTISSLISVSVDPPTIAFSLSQESSSGRALAECETVIVHLVRRKTIDLATLCATRGTIRFGPKVRWTRLATGEPYYPQHEIWFRAALGKRLSLPGACLVSAELLSAPSLQIEPKSGDAVVYADHGWHGLHPLADTANPLLQMWPFDSATF
jgi:flavin reductase (DIM6/NTAB) family NADH-FMN oxidoreductase RutF